MWIVGWSSRDIQMVRFVTFRWSGSWNMEDLSLHTTCVYVCGCVDLWTIEFVASRGLVSTHHVRICVWMCGSLNNRVRDRQRTCRDTWHLVSTHDTSRGLISITNSIIEFVTFRWSSSWDTHAILSLHMTPAEDLSLHTTCVYVCGCVNLWTIEFVISTCLYTLHLYSTCLHTACLYTSHLYTSHLYTSRFSTSHLSTSHLSTSHLFTSHFSTSHFYTSHLSTSSRVYVCVWMCHV